MICTFLVKRMKPIIICYSVYFQLLSFSFPIDLFFILIASPGKYCLFIGNWTAKTMPVRYDKTKTVHYHSNDTLITTWDSNLISVVWLPFDCCVPSLYFPHRGFILQLTLVSLINVWQINVLFFLGDPPIKFSSYKRLFSIIYLKLFSFTSHFRAEMLWPGAFHSIWQRLSLWKQIIPCSKKLTFIQECSHSPLKFIPHFRYMLSLIHKPWQAVIYWN